MQRVLCKVGNMSRNGAPRPRSAPSPLAGASLGGIYDAPDAARGAALVAGVFLTAPSQARTRAELARQLTGVDPDMAHGQLDQFMVLGYLTAVKVAGTDAGQDSPVLAYRLTPVGRTRLGAHRRRYLQQLQDLDRELAASGIPPPPPGRDMRKVPLLSPGLARTVLHLYMKAAREEHMGPCPLTEISAAVAPGTGMGRSHMKTLVSQLQASGWLASEARRDRGAAPRAVTLTPRGRAVFPVAASRLRGMLALMQREVTGLEQALDR